MSFGSSRRSGSGLRVPAPEGTTQAQPASIVLTVFQMLHRAKRRAPKANHSGLLTEVDIDGYLSIRQPNRRRLP
jgi:hypothetical protein